jgi:hypothetical protein
VRVICHNNDRDAGFQGFRAPVPESAMFDPYTKVTTTYLSLSEVDERGEEKGREG